MPRRCFGGLIATDQATTKASPAREPIGRIDFFLRHFGIAVSPAPTFTRLPRTSEQAMHLIASGDRVPSAALDRFREPNPITRQAALVRRHLVAHGDARLLVFR